MFDFQIKKDFFDTKLLGRNFYHFQTIDSTQIFAKKNLLENKISAGTLILADHQQMGKGTQGRSWVSLPRPQLMFSIVLQCKFPPQKLPIINILSAVLMADLFEEYRIHPQIKWPNDIYIDHRKTAGILSELVIHQGLPHIILGIGVNIDGNLDEFPEELQDKVTALSIHANRVDRFSILENFMQNLEKMLFSDMSIDEVISYTQSRFKTLWMYKNKTIDVQQDHKTLHGTANEIDNNGALLLQTDEGIKKIINGSILPTPSD